jgi:NAD(P)-dependent dehydrogenase (short-subunit alcohol dehydrogenase family)
MTHAWRKRKWQASEAYAETKFHDVLLAFAVARLWPEVLSNSIEPGWVPTKMGGPDAPDDLEEGYITHRIGVRHLLHRGVWPVILGQKGPPEPFNIFMVPVGKWSDGTPAPLPR